MTDYKIGTTYEGLTSLASLTVPLLPPKSPFKPYAEVRDTGSGLARGIGRPVTQWTWALLTNLQRDQLREYCTGASAQVYITTRTNEDADTFATYLATMLWPQDYEERDFLRRPEFTVLLRDLVLIPDPEP